MSEQVFGGIDSNTGPGIATMQTFMARFVRPNGDRGVIYVVAASAALAMLDVMQQQGPVADVNVIPRRRAALLLPPLWTPPRHGVHR